MFWHKGTITAFIEGQSQPWLRALRRREGLDQRRPNNRASQITGSGLPATIPLKSA
jgi:hypothetical protein